MATCASCGSTILFGGVQDGQDRYCNATCSAEAALLRVSDAVSPDDVERTVRQVFDGPCPRCAGPGPVELHVSYRIWSALVMTQWRSIATVGCERCGRRARLGSLAFSLVLGWWGAPWGVLMTPVMVVRNLLGFRRSGGLNQPSEALRRSVRLGLAETLVAQQASLAAPRAPAPGGGQPWG
jgi:hypothetical protein